MRYSDAAPKNIMDFLFVELLHWGNFLTPGVEAIRDPLFYGRLPDWGDALYLVLAAVLSLALGAFVFNRVDDQIAIEV